MNNADELLAYPSIGKDGALLISPPIVLVLPSLERSLEHPLPHLRQSVCTVVGLRADGLAPAALGMLSLVVVEASEHGVQLDPRFEAYHEYCRRLLMMIQRGQAQDLRAMS